MTATNTIDWVDLTTVELDRALAFYHDVLGWTYERSTSPMGDYHVALAGGHQAAGLMAPAEGEAPPPAWTSFVRVAALEPILAAATTAGGRVVAGPFPIPGGARVAVIADPTGAVLAAIDAGPEPGPGEPPLRRPEPGAVGWSELVTRDPDAAVAFYGAVFGWRGEVDAATGYVVLRLEGVDVAGVLAMPAGVPDAVPSYWGVYFHVTDVPAAAEAARRAGGAVLQEPMTVGTMTFAVLADPAGAVFCVLGL